MVATATGVIRLSWEDPATGETHEWVGPAPVLVGRSGENSVVLNSHQVSRQHVRLEHAADGLILRDGGSSNGTYVNGVRVTQATLSDGDTFAVGPFTLMVRVGSPPASGAIATQPALRLSWQDASTGRHQMVDLNRPITIGRAASNDVVLTGGSVSRHHATIAPEGGQPVLSDQGSANGVAINGGRVERAALRPGDVITIDEFRLDVELAPSPPDRSAPGRPATAPPARDQYLGRIVPSATADDGHTLVLDTAVALASLRSGPSFPPAFFREPVVPMAAVAAAGLPVDTTVYFAVGGGLGSFTWADHLVVYGAPPEHVVAIGLEELPYGRYARLCRQSQIPEFERLRSNSDSCPDNLWGWPGYAVREIYTSLLGGDFGNALRRAWQIFGEPTFAETYTPRAGDVFRSIDREADRIGWSRMWRYGRVVAIRKTDDGRYVVAYSQSTPEQPSVHRLMVAQYVHLAIGYPGIRLLPDLQRYREQTQDFRSVVNAYEDHEHVYQGLLKHGGVVLVRGRGIVASRIIQRLYELRQQNPRVGVLHLMRSPLAQGNRFGRSQRVVENHWEFQPFNWPKSCWGGELRVQLERANEHERDMLLNEWGGTTTADRSDWRQIVVEGLRKGWYQIRFGEVRQVVRNQPGKLVTTLVGKGLIHEQIELEADYVIDCTGLEATVDAHPLLKDLVEHHELARSVKGRLRVANDFEVVGMESGQGRMYASGAMTLGGPLAAVDSFLGLQYAALASVEALVAQGAPGLRSLHPIRSLFQWLKWASGEAP
ncbi:MAG: FHA domain-containing protein [Chloroflexi bacterium]|nr:FHA domain-containing protein [Chloroflexota bacterium]